MIVVDLVLSEFFSATWAVIWNRFFFLGSGAARSKIYKKEEKR